MVLIVKLITFPFDKESKTPEAIQILTTLEEKCQEYKCFDSFTLPPLVKVKQKV